MHLERLEPRVLLSAAPVAVDDAWEVPQDQPTLLDTLLANDSPGDGRLLVIDGFTQPDRGTVLDGGDGALIYLPRAGFLGEDAFTYTIADEHGRQSTATVQLTVLPLPGDMRDSGLTAAEEPIVVAPGFSAADVSEHATPSEILDALGGAIPTNAAGLPLLHSLPSATVAVFLDFDGWDWVEAYDVDGAPGVFNAEEQATVVSAWRDVATTFAMFDVDVTTEQPDFATTPTNYGAIGNNVSGGYSYLTFPSTTPKAFNASGNARSRTTGISHEIGHNFGLRHQSDYDLLGIKTREYSKGDDDLHVPLMGVDYAGRLPQFTLGHPSGGPDQLQDDVAKIATKIAARAPGSDGYRADDFGSTIALATPLAVDGSTASAAGIIGRLNDVDTFSFASDGGPLLVSARPDYPSAADLKLEVYDALGTLLAAEDSPQNGQDLLLELPPGTYYAEVSSHGDYSDLGVYTIETRPLGAGWNTQDIGEVATTGYAALDDATGVFTIGGSGSDIYGSSDDFRYVYQTLDGDGQITARVTSLTDTSSWAKAGVMIRESLDDDAKNVLVAVTTENGVTAQRRATTGGSTSSTVDSGHTAPYWVRLTRSGDRLTAERSANGSSWQTVNTFTVSMAEEALIGLAVTARKKREFNVATFDSVSLSGGVGVVDLPGDLPAPAGLTLALGDGTGVHVDWNEVPGAEQYVIERSEDNVNFTPVGTTATGATGDPTEFEDLGLFGSMRYFYRVRAVDASGASAASASATIVNRPNATADAAVTSWQTDTIVLNWTDVSGDTGYRIERSTDGVNFTQVATVGTNVPTWNNTRLSTATVYHYRITPLSPQGDGPSTVVTGSTRLPALNGLAFTSVASDAVALQWNPIAGVSDYRIRRSSDGEDYTVVETVSGVTSYVDHDVNPVEEYYYRVSGVNEHSESEGTATVFTATPWDEALPFPWNSQDIGNVGGDGAVSLSGNTFTQIAAGSDIWGGSDAFRFTYRALEGDGQITARVTNLEDTSGWAKAGLMIRDSLDANAKNIMVRLSPDHGVGVQWRSLTGASSLDADDVDAEAPQWLRLSRAGNDFTAEYSSDGIVWESFGSRTITIGSSAYIGLALCSHDNDELNTTTFERVEVQAAGNSSPTAVDDHAAIDTNGRAIVAVLTNDGDVDGDPLTIVEFTQAARGTVTDPGDGTLVYTPVDWFVGTDTFGYTITDGQEGFNTGTVTIVVGNPPVFDRPIDTFLEEASPTQNNAAATSLNVDGEDNNGEVQALLRFEDLFGGEPGQVPAGATIHRATLTLDVFNDGHSFGVYRMLRGWEDTDTWSSLGGGIATDGVEAAAVAELTTGGVDTGTLVLDVTMSVQAWAADPSANLGWVLSSTGSDGVDFDSAEGNTPPRLAIDYVGQPLPDPAAVVGRYVFYNHSSFDGEDPATGPADDAAIATDKTPLLPGQTATLINYTSYSRGLNGIMIDVAEMPGTPTAADFRFRVGNDTQPDAWDAGPQPTAVAVRPGEGVAGSDRVTITFGSRAVAKQWLQVTMLATPETGLEADDVFYFGNAIAEGGDSATAAHVSTTDLLLARNNSRTFLNPATIDFLYDYDRDQRVDATDVLLARNNQTNFLTALRLIDLSGG